MFGPFPNPKNSPLGPQKVKSDPKSMSKSNVRIERNKEADPKTVVEPYFKPKNSPLGPQKVKKDPEMKSNSKVIIERNIENESHSTT